MELIERVNYASAFSFKYSPRPGTPGAELPDQVDDRTKSERLAALQDLIFSQQSAFNSGCVGRVLPVLIDKPGRMPGQIAGRSPYLQAVHAKGDVSPDRDNSAGRDRLGRQKFTSWQYCHTRLSPVLLRYGVIC